MPCLPNLMETQCGALSFLRESLSAALLAVPPPKTVVSLSGERTRTRRVRVLSRVRTAERERAREVASLRLRVRLRRERERERERETHTSAPFFFARVSRDETRGQLAGAKQSEKAKGAPVAASTPMYELDALDMPRIPSACEFVSRLVAVFSLPLKNTEETLAAELLAAPSCQRRQLFFLQSRRTHLFFKNHHRSLALSRKTRGTEACPLAAPDDSAAHLRFVLSSYLGSFQVSDSGTIESSNVLEHKST